MQHTTGCYYCGCNCRAVLNRPWSLGMKTTKPTLQTPKRTLDRLYNDTFLAPCYRQSLEESFVRQYHFPSILQYLTTMTKIISKLTVITLLKTVMILTRITAILMTKSSNQAYWTTATQATKARCMMPRYPPDNPSISNYEPKKHVKKLSKNQKCMTMLNILVCTCFYLPWAPHPIDLWLQVEISICIVFVYL